MISKFKERTEQLIDIHINRMINIFLDIDVIIILFN